MAYNIASNASTSQITGAVNYILANFNGSMNANQVTGAVTGPGNTILSYLYQYMDVMYAQSYDGSVGFSPSPTNATYYGLRNTNVVGEDTNYTDYVWYATTGFGTTNFLWYNVTGGRAIRFVVAATAPSPYFTQVQDNTQINLDILSGVNTTKVSIYIWGTSTAPTRPTTTSIYTWATGVVSNVPTGWSVTIPSNSTAGAVLWSITINLVSNNTQATSVLDWTNTANPIVSTSSIGTPGASTFVVIRTAYDGSPPTNAEVIAVIGRYPVAGDICTLNYNAGNNSEVFKYSGTSWGLFQTYITGDLIVSNSITASNINSNGLTIRDLSGNILLGVGNPLNYTNITPSSNWINSNITLNSNGTLSGAGGGAVTIGGLGFTGALNANYTYVDGSGKIQGVGSGAGTTVANNAISIISGAIQGIGTGSGTTIDNTLITLSSNGQIIGGGGGQVTLGGLGFTGSLNANYTYIDGSGALQGVGSGAGTIVDNHQIFITSGLIQGIGTGNATPVANALITINSNGTLSGAGGGSVTISGLGYNGSLYATQNNVYIQSTTPTSPQNGDIWVNTAPTLPVTYLYSGGAFQTAASYGATFGTNITGQITSSNASTYIASAAIGSAQIGVLLAGNIGAGQIDATKINVSNLSAISANMGTITAGTLAAGTVIAGALSSATGTFAGSLQAASGTFTGSLTAATGTFAGNLSAAGGTFTGSLSAATGTFAGSLSAATGTFAGSLSAASGTFTGSLSAASGTFTGSLSAATGTFNGTLSVGSSPAQSGTGMSGSGAVFNNSGTFAIGNSTTNISFDGSGMYLNGNVVSTQNINANAISNIVGNATAGSAGLTSSLQTIVSEAITTSGGSVVVNYSGIVALAAGTTGGVVITLSIYRDSTQLYSVQLRLIYPVTGVTTTPPAATFIDTPSSGSHTYTLQASSSGSNTTISSAYLVLQEFKR
jgi:hypothetical protein